MGENSIDAVAEAYGMLWHIVSSDKRLLKARHLLRDLLNADQRHWGISKAKEEGARPKRRPYNASGSLSEYGVLTECDAQQTADDKVVFIDGVGAGRRTIESCRDGVQWVMIGDKIYWPLSDADAQRLQSACCGNWSFDGPSTVVQPEAV